MSIPYRCPVCDGKGLVPVGFYRFIGVPGGTSASVEPEKCRSCNGTGIVWGYQQISMIPSVFTPIPPLELTPLNDLCPYCGKKTPCGEVHVICKDGDHPNYEKDNQ